MQNSSNPPAQEAAVSPERWDRLLPALTAARGMNRFKREYLSSLITFGRELDACGRHGAADILHGKITGDLQERQKEKPEERPSVSLGFEKVSEQMREAESSELETFYRRYRTLFPPGERDYYDGKMREVREETGSRAAIKRTGGTFAATGHFESRSGSALRQVRHQLYDCVYRYTSALTGGSDGPADKKTKMPEETGTYNALFNMNKALDLLGKIDPLWVEDMKSHYREVQRFQAMFS